MIYHVVYKTAWQEALNRGFYAAASLATEGFIHASRIEQVAGVLERYYPRDENLMQQKTLLLLHIDELKLTAPLKIEMAHSVGETFPHIYGQLNLDAVVNIEEL